MADEDAISDALLAYRQGIPGGFDRLVTLVYDDLRRIARRQLGRVRPGHTINTTGLVHEAYLKMVDPSRVSLQDRAHFFAVAARAMRQILVDHARRRGRRKRGGDPKPTTFDEAMTPIAADAERILLLHDALDRLTAVDARLTQVVECRFFAGYSEDETAEILGVSSRTIRRDWLRARAWLHELMYGGPGSPAHDHGPFKSK
ncbi:MAG TPA: ECF-type sigma factor [Vicinamibacterales bacterium]|nr:ECF-type sigma factor [Vicinamibacterales bacterium]